MLCRGGSFNLSQDVKDKISKANKGRKITWADKVSEGVRKLWIDPVYRAKQTLQRHEKRGAYRKHTKPLRLELDTKAIKKMYNSGLTIYKIAQKLNVSFGVIKRRI